MICYNDIAYVIVCRAVMSFLTSCCYFDLLITPKLEIILNFFKGPCFLFSCEETGLKFAPLFQGPRKVTRLMCFLAQLIKAIGYHRKNQGSICTPTKFYFFLRLSKAVMIFCVKKCRNIFPKSISLDIRSVKNIHQMIKS